jgi:hypothetical protein
MTGEELIQSAMEIIGAIAIGQSPTATEKTRILERLNMMLSSLYSEQYFVPNEEEMSYGISTAITAPVSIGLDPGGSSVYGGSHIAQVRPLDLGRAKLQSTGGEEYPLDLVSWKDYDERFRRKATSGRPAFIAYKPGWLTGYIAVYPLPSESYNVKLSVLKSFVFISDTTAELGYPTEYMEPLMYLLALRISTMFGKTPDNEVKKLAKDLKHNLKQVQYGPSSISRFDSDFGGRYRRGGIGSFEGGY